MNNLPSLATLEKSLSFIPLTRHPSPDKDHAQTLLGEIEGDGGLNCADYILIDDGDTFGILIAKDQHEHYQEMVDEYEKSCQEWASDEDEE